MFGKIPFLFLLLTAVGVMGFLITKQQETALESLIAQDIQKAVEAGDYRCCIEPPCTMCYLEANQWNNFTAGTCACDDLIAQGKEPCPQCKQGLCGTDVEGTCKVNGNKNE